MAALFYSVVRRHMKHTSPGSFSLFGPGVECPKIFPLREDEQIIGWYRNPAPFEDSLVVFTSQALVVIDSSKIDRIPLSDITDAEMPRTKADASGIRIRTRDGFRFIRVAGSFGPYGHQKDAYSFLMVMNALLSMR